MTILSFDILVVFNQDLPVSRLCEMLAGKYRSALLVTTHELFPNEKAELNSIGLDQLEVRVLSDLMNDKEMEAIDNHATELLMPYAGLSNFFVRFQDQTLYEKNALVCKRLKENYTFSVSMVMPGLGVSGRFWKEQGASLLGTERVDIMTRLANKASVWMSKLDKQEMYFVESSTNDYLFLGPIKRLHFTAEAKITKFVSPWYREYFPVLLKKLRKSSGKNVVPSTTIHGLTDHRILNFPNLHVFVDGFHPPNYTRSYLDSYGEAIFVTRHMFDDGWFSGFGKKTAKAPAFVKRGEMSEPLPVNQVKTVSLMLNHAGDWSSLINRSDTDRLIVAFAELSPVFPDVNFVIRRHPTMVLPQHEGVNSMERIANYVEATGYKNLSCSDVDLATDFQRADILISEYSQTIIDGAINGKLMLIVNLTGRRSYMECFEDIGFPHVESAEELLKFMTAFIADPGAVRQQQKVATGNFNSRLAAYLAEK